MKEDPRIQAWSRARANGEVPKGFADRVMSRIEQGEDRRRATGVLLVLTAVVGSRPGLLAATALAATALAACVFLYRAVCSFGVFITG